MRITKRQLKRIIKEADREDMYRMSTPEQRRFPDDVPGTMEDAARLLNGVLDDWTNHPDMNHDVGDKFRMRIAEVIDMIEDVVGQQRT